MIRSWMKLAGTAALACGLMAAQTTTPTPNSHSRHGGHHRAFMAHGFDRMAQALNLTDAQKEQAKALFAQNREQAKPIVQQLKQNREAIAAAVKADKPDSELQRLADQQGVLVGQLTGLRLKAMAKMYSSLTPEQQQKADQLHDHFRAQRHAPAPRS